MSGNSGMNRLSRQRGISFWGIAINILILGAFMMMVLKVAPNYMTYLTIKDVIERAASDFDPRNESTADLRTRIRKLLTTSQVYEVTIDDIEVFRENGNIVIDATYETRFPLVWIVDGVMVFDDLIIEIPGRSST